MKSFDSAPSLFTRAVEHQGRIDSDGNMRNETVIPFFMQKKKVSRLQIPFRNHFDTPFPPGDKLSRHISDGLELQFNGCHLF
jgi:hypothetical protein